MKTISINLVNLASGFYQKIATIKVWVRDGQLDSEVMAMLKLDSLPRDDETAAAVSLHLNQWIVQTQLKYRDSLTNHEQALLSRACFAMVSLADELLIMELQWSGKAHWDEVLLEQQIYQSCSAGEVLFDHIDELLADGNYDELECQLAALYLLVLRLGFCGRYRDDDTQLAYYRNKLFYIVNRGQTNVSEKISNDAYQQCLVSEHEQRLAPLANWYRAMFYGVIGYVVGGIAIYYSITWGLNQWIAS